MDPYLKWKLLIPVSICKTVFGRVLAPFVVLFASRKLIYFQGYTVKVYPWLPSRCFRKNLGWKLWGFDGTDKNLQYVAYVNPLKGAKR